jgi:predicted unusual protein kinase regulating ubiquinone biosynthesis (AarF/ABC1/UbiB family)
MLVNNKDLLGDVELLMNLLFQTYISIATFQNLLGYIHKDAHYGNFLYQLNNEMGYYHYIFDGKDYYLKACKYNIIIFDYGFARKINMNAKYDLVLSNKESRKIFEDYRRIINAFMNKKSGWGYYLKLPDENINNRMLEIAAILDRILYNELTATTINIQQFHVRIFNSIIEDIFLKYTPSGMFITQRPPNVINVAPFVIN